MTELPSFSEIDWQQAEADDNNAIEQLLKGAGEGEPILNDDRELEIGEKADDAEDFEDIGDDDLPDEEEPTIKKEQLEPSMDDIDYDEDDLFGDGGRASSPFEDSFDTQNKEFIRTPEDIGNVNADIVLPTLEPEPEIDLRELNFPSTYDADEDLLIPTDIEEVRKLVQENFPSFEVDGILFWNKLLKTKGAYWTPQAPSKPPKPVNPTKISLDLAVDQEKSFRGSVPFAGDKLKRVPEASMKGIITIENESIEYEESEDDFDYLSPDPSDKVSGYTLQELEFICSDFEKSINAVCLPDKEEIEEEPMDEWEREILGHSSNLRKRTFEAEKDFSMEPRYPVPSFDNYEEMTAQVAKRVIIDLNDPHLLLDIQDYDPQAKRQRLNSGNYYTRTCNNSLTSSLTSRFNYSNDEAYEALKENHQSKVRAILGHLTVEHAMPALKLQWPYYQVKLFVDQARSFHRPALKFKRFLGQLIHFSKPGMRKKKAVKGMHTHEIFKETKDLSLADHYSTATLFEYSEEHPTVLSGFGMGNRIINYYRRKNADDSERPQPGDKIGDTTVLLPEDRSPFSNFGMVDPGQTVRTLHNSMFRAPIFKHATKPTDFLCIRSSTGVEGTKWHIRNIDNIFVVGQQLPSMEVPGPHSRKVTNAAKNRMKMIAYRKIRHSAHHHVKIADVTAHITDSTDMQNRQKLKEFMTYDKVEKVWKMPAGDPVRDEAQIRSMIKPEDVCVLDAMQVGSRYLEDAGYEAKDDKDGKENDVIDGDTEESLEQSLAPWSTTKSFLDASADKAMLALKGPGDPSGCGLALSFLKTSMKGGFLQNLGKDKGDAHQKAREALDPSKNGGHTYNVKLQQNIYNNTIREIWDMQMADLSETNENRLTQEEIDRVETPRGAHFDDTASQYTSMSMSEKIMRITRKYKNKMGQIEEFTETVTDPRVWKAYQKRRIEIDTAGREPTGNPEKDEAQKRAIKKELARLNKNRVRRHVREKQKGRINTPQATSPGSGGSPSSAPTPSIETSTGTTRKCANCGQAGHIKTNKKLCPMLNGTMKQYDSNPKHGGFGTVSAPSF
ncbi:putative transcription initiation factor TFIID 111 kDa subunit [Golovinomyces cichoracearum]|uniref:Putative transcription initiation factor TFIID 111 kDa subunit n=1 Tax=Golovinomyces cichoracearum TaxID=62708 RepID=A0A420IMN2_9PEZI|nr:putative transcription initiation factor TFIID 111 kDa subunit [Golovinomyces cichoracearum]